MQRANPADIDAVLQRRVATRVPAAHDVPGAHVWAASGLIGWAGSSPTNVWAQAGMRDAFADLRSKQHDPTDWVTTVANSMNRSRK